MPRSSPILAVVACAALSACRHTASVGSFAVEVPRGWYLERTEPDSIAVGTRHAEWSFVLVAFSEAQLSSTDSLEAVGTEVARTLTEPDGPALAFASARPWTQAGLDGVILDGTLSDAELSIAVKLAVLAGADQYLVAFGFRSPDAQGRHDQGMQDLLASIRPEP